MQNAKCKMQNELRSANATLTMIFIIIFLVSETKCSEVVPRSAFRTPHLRKRSAFRTPRFLGFRFFFQFR